MMETAVLVFLFVLIALFYIVLLGGVVAAVIFWICMLVDAIKRDFPGKDDKVIWVLVIIFVGLIGATIYYFVVKREDKKKKKIKK